MQFVFTTCPTICPAMSGAMAAFQEKLGADARGVRMVSISIDPEHDRPGRLLAYAKSLGAGPQWSFYTGRAKDIAAIQRAFDADAANKMWHRPLTFIRPRKGATWTRLEGLPGGAELLDEYRRAVRP